MESTAPDRFAALLTAAIQQIKRREGISIRALQDELGYALGKDGGSIVEFWRKGHLPAKQRDLETLARWLVARGQLDRPWLEALLLAAGQVGAADALCNELFAPASIPVTQPPQPSAPAPFQVPAVTPHFVGRSDQLDAVRRDLLDPAAPRVLALVGMGGAGKSTLAARLAHSLRADFPDGVLWVYAAAAEPLDILQQWAQLYGHDFRGIADVANRAAAVRGIWHGRRVLIVLDDVRAPEHLRPLLPGVPTCATILTTRDRDLVALVNAQPVVVDELDDAQSLALLSAIAGAARVGREEEAAQAIVRTVGHLPLALEITARLLARAPWQSLAEMAARLADAARRLDRLTLKDLSVRAAFAVSWEALAADLRPLFSALGLFQARSCSYAALAATAGVAPDTVAEGLAALAALSLVQFDGPDRVRQHPLLADFARERLDEPAVTARWAAYYLAFASTHRADPDRIDGELEHLMAVLATLHAQAMWPQVVALVDALHPTWVARAHYGQALRGYAWAVQAAQAQGDLAAQAQALVHLGYVHSEQSDFAAAATELRAGLAAAQAVADGPLAATAQLYLARIAWEQNALETADELLDACWQHYLAGGDEHGCARVLRERGFLAYRQGDYRTTQALCLQALAIQERLADHPGVLGSVRVLADTAMATGDLAQALAYGERALALAEAAGLQAELAEAHFTLATVQRLRRELAAAQHHAAAALALFERFGNRTFMAYTLSEQSVILTFAGDAAAALPLAQRALAIQEELGDSYGRVTTLLHLGDLYKLHGELERATATWRAGWELAREIRYPHIQAFHRRLAGPAVAPPAIEQPG